MAQCELCNKKMKFFRECPALNKIICSTCCGTKRELEIKCISNCEFLVESKIKENRKQIKQIVKESFNNEFEDIYQNKKIVRFVGPFEQFIFNNYYNSYEVTDEFMTECYTKIYYSLDTKESIYNFNEIEASIFNEFKKNTKKTRMSIKKQKLILIRMMKSVDNMTGGMFGNRMYLELLRHNFTNTGLVTDVTRTL